MTSSLVRLRRYRLLLWSLVLSLLFHFVIVPLVLGLLGFHREIPQPRETVYQVSSSSLQLARRTIPQPHRMTQPQPVPAHPPAHPQVRQAAPPPQERREIARIRPDAPRTARHVTSTMGFEQQQVQFEKTIAKLREESNPLVSAARPVATPGAVKRFSYDFSGSVGTAPQAEGILTPVKSWHDGPYDYYYVQYWAQYADGSTETGYVPWPIRYLPKNDPFLRHWEHFPLPVPLANFALPPGTNLHPLVAYCYEHRTEMPSCPIEHD